MKDAIGVPLMQLCPLARQVYSKGSIAAIAWAVYHQSMFFAQGDMVGKTPLTSKWVQMKNTVRGGGRFLENYSIPIALANRAPPISPINTRKDNEDDDKDQDGSGIGKGRKKSKKGKNKDKDKDKDGHEIKGGGKVMMYLNLILIKAKTP